MLSDVILENDIEDEANEKPLKSAK